MNLIFKPVLNGAILCIYCIFSSSFKSSALSLNISFCSLIWFPLIPSEFSNNPVFCPNLVFLKGLNFLDLLKYYKYILTHY